jgi:hypothetical protein
MFQDLTPANAITRPRSHPGCAVPAKEGNLTTAVVNGQPVLVRQSHRLAGEQYGPPLLTVNSVVTLSVEETAALLFGWMDTGGLFSELADDGMVRSVVADMVLKWGASMLMRRTQPRLVATRPCWSTAASGLLRCSEPAKQYYRPTGWTDVAHSATPSSPTSPNTSEARGRRWGPRLATAESLHGHEVTGSTPEASRGGGDRQAGSRADRQHNASSLTSPFLRVDWE